MNEVGSDTPSPFKSRSGLGRVVAAWRYSMDGLRAAFRSEVALRQELAVTVALVPLGWWLASDWRDAALLAGAVVLVLIVELLNSAIEAVVDRVSLEVHPLAKRAKDIGSAAVLLALFLCGGIWLSALVARLSA